MLSSEAVADLAALALRATGEFTIDELLRDVCTVAAHALDVDGAGVMISEQEGVRYVHADPVRIANVETLQEVLQSGPCSDCMHAGAAIVLNDITLTSQWPEFAGAWAAADIRGLIAMPLLARGGAWGALDVYRNEARPWTEEEIAAVGLFAGIAAAYLVMAADRDAARSARESLERAATHDELTGLPGRALLYRMLEHALGLARRRETAVAVFFIDLDRFKDVNDAFGHAAGDAVLIEVSDRLKRALRGNDIIARLSGDEFVVFFEDLSRDPDQLKARVHALGHRLDNALSRPMHVAGSDIVVSASIGVAVTSNGEDAQELIEDADSAMYQAKEWGRGRLVVSSRNGQSSAGSRRHLESELSHSLDHDELRVFYQPIVAVDSQHTVVAVEALLRWQHPQHGLLAADSFIGLAERSGAIGAIGRWVIDQACAQLASWQRQLGERAPQRVFVNLSPREISDPSLDAALAAAVDAHGVSPGSLGLEIVEYDFTDALLAPRLAEHRDRGHPLAVDDFGTGFSSLSRLVDFPVDYAKIDQSFVQGLPQDRRRRTLIEAIVNVAHELGLTVIAEGVETKEQVIDLTAAGCDLLQGYYLSRPTTGGTLTSQWTELLGTEQPPALGADRQGE